MDTAWINRHWRNINLGDIRLDKRARSFAKALTKHPQRTVARAFDEWSQTKAAYRLLASGKVSHSKIQEPHYK